MRELVLQLSDALTGGDDLDAENALERVMTGLWFGLVSRATAVGALADVPIARAAMYDCLRTMCEAIAHVTWITARPPDMLARAVCIELGQAKADVHNRRRLVTIQNAPWISDQIRSAFRHSLEEGERAEELVRVDHATPCPRCRGRGRGEGTASSWLRDRASRRDAAVEDVNRYTIWVWCSAYAHQLAPQLHTREEANYVDLPEVRAQQAVGWAMQLLLTSTPEIAYALRPDAADDIRGVRTWWERDMVERYPWLRSHLVGGRRD
jgi:hypothetical protein